MVLSRYSVMHERDGAGDPLVHCYDGNQLVLAYISHKALKDKLLVPGASDPTLSEWNSVVELNIDALSQIIADKYERGEWSIHKTYTQSYLRLHVTSEDIDRSGAQLSAEGVRPRSGFKPGAAEYSPVVIPTRARRGHPAMADPRRSRLKPGTRRLTKIGA
jgi:hypothetical protein